MINIFLQKIKYFFANPFKNFKPLNWQKKIFENLPMPKNNSPGRFFDNCPGELFAFLCAN